MFPLRQFRKYNFTFHNSNHALSAWQGRKKKQQFTEVRNFEFIYKTTVSILCLYFYVTPVQIQCPFLYINQALLLFFFSKYQSIYISCCPKGEVCMKLAPPPPLPFVYFLISVHLLQTPDNSNSVLVTRTFFNFPTRFKLSGVDYIIVA